MSGCAVQMLSVPEETVSPEVFRLHLHAVGEAQAPRAEEEPGGEEQHRRREHATARQSREQDGGQQGESKG